MPSLYFAAGTELGPETSEERQRLYLDMMAERRIAIMESVQRRLEEQQARERDALEAEARAKELLYLALSPDQQKSIEERGHFVFKSQHGNHYRILTNQGTEGNIKQLSAEDGYVVQGWCAATKIDGRDRMIPKWDTFLGQMLDLQANEDAFMRIANRY